MWYLSIRDSKAFTMNVGVNQEVSHENGQNALQLAAKYSESLELIRSFLQIHHSMVKKIGKYSHEIFSTTVGFLCRRPHFTSFYEMYECLVTADSSVEVVSDGIVCLFKLCEKTSCVDEAVLLARVKFLLQANLSFKICDDGKGILHYACEL
jgi:hypothetical protein